MPVATAATSSNTMKQQQCRFTWTHLPLSRQTTTPIPVSTVESRLCSSGGSLAIGFTTMITSSTDYPILEGYTSGMLKTKSLCPARSAVSPLDDLPNLTAVSLRVYINSIVPVSFARTTTLMVRTLSRIRRMCIAIWGRKKLGRCVKVGKSSKSVTTWPRILW